MKTTDQTPVAAIPTVYRGHTFRSRLEAKWACFFDNCGWPWEYEPIDLNGYIPDFILTFKQPLLVEVKPELYIEDIDSHWWKIKASGWKHEAMIVGAKLFDRVGGFSNMGVLGKLAERDQCGGWRIGSAILETCAGCNRISLYHSDATWNCRVNGCYDGNRFLNPFTFQEARELFADCGRVVQYNT